MSKKEGGGIDLDKDDSITKRLSIVLIRWSKMVSIPHTFPHTYKLKSQQDSPIPKGGGREGGSDHVLERGKRE